jgi:hypothetical protein
MAKIIKNKIAIIGFGSLLFNHKGLSIGPFRKNGPYFPLEFSRISRDGRLTVAIDWRNGTYNQTYYAISKHNDLDKVIAEFQKREKIKDKFLNVQIGIWDIKNNLFNYGASKFPAPMFDQIGLWAKKNKIDAIVFSALAPKFKDKLKIPYTNESAFLYLNTLKPALKKKAIQYIKNVPIKTKFSEYFEENRI